VEIQKQEVLSFVSKGRESGRSVSEMLKSLKISRSSYYRWLKAKPRLLGQQGRITKRRVTSQELARVDQIKDGSPELRHRQIQGLLQLEGHFLSSTVVYRHLKSQGKVEPYDRRAAPWKEPHYEVIRSNIMWGADWTKLRIGGCRWYLLTLIDFFSRYLIHYDIVPTVNAGHIRRVYEMGLASQNISIENQHKPELRLDQGSPNTARTTKQFFKDIQADLSFARVRRPTDNALTERFYRTIKQEEIYLVGDYQDLPTAHEVIGDYIKWYNEKRPHQALWNFTPWLVHETTNKTHMLNALKELKQKTWTERRDYWEGRKKLTPTK
jgi:putative transposase